MSCICSAIVSKMAETEIDYMIQLLVETKVRIYIFFLLVCEHVCVYDVLQDPRFMDFLGNLCVCESRAIPSTQSKRMKLLT